MESGLIGEALKPSQMDEELITDLLNFPYYMCPPHNVSCSTMARCMLNVEFLLYKLWPGFHIIIFNGGKTENQNGVAVGIRLVFHSKATLGLSGEREDSFPLPQLTTFQFRVYQYQTTLDPMSIELMYKYRTYHFCKYCIFPLNTTFGGHTGLLHMWQWL